MNTIDINQVSIWKPEGSVTADKFLLYNFHGYDFDGSPSKVSFKIGSVVSASSPEGSDSFVSAYEGTVELPNEVVQEWGIDDSPIYNYALNALGLTRA